MADALSMRHDGMQLKDTASGRIPYFQFSRLAAQAGLTHGLFTRHGGASAPPFDSLNVSFGVGDAPACVAANRRHIMAQWPHHGVLGLQQVHGVAVHVAEDGPVPSQMDFFAAKARFPTADALITGQPGLLLLVQVADCQPILLFDPVRRVVANIHAGWRGAIANIAGQTIDRMQVRFGCRPADLMAGVGPSLGPCCAEFIHYQREIPAGLHGYVNERAHLDLWALSRDQLCAAGLRAENIALSRICTRCHAHDFFSFRKAATTGRLAMLIGLAPDC